VVDNLADRELDVIPIVTAGDDPVWGIPVLLDSASPVITLPPWLTTRVHDFFHAMPGKVDGKPAHFVDCAWRERSAYLYLVFGETQGYGSANIIVDVKDFVIDLGAGGAERCALMVYPSQDGTYVLGGE
jgi:hypothetical protein